jgi:hypothetical protein
MFENILPERLGLARVENKCIDPQQLCKIGVGAARNTGDITVVGEDES